MRFLTASLVIAVSSACVATEAPTDSDKEDNFLSETAKEFLVSGESFITVEPDLTEAQTERRIKELIALKSISISWFLNKFLVEDQASNGDVIGFGAMVKTGRHMTGDDIRQINARSYAFTFEQVIAGRRNMRQRLRNELDESDEFSIIIGKVDNDELADLEQNHEWYRRLPWNKWKFDAEPENIKENLTLTLSDVAPTADAWWDYNRLIEDGVLDIDVHFGWDFHDAHHLKNSRALHNWLVREKGFTSPVDDFDDYKRTSPPLTRELDADGETITVEIRIFYGKPGTSTDPETDAGGALLERDMRRSFEKRDVIAFEGHSGSFYGFPLASWKKTKEGDFDDSEMRTADMPGDKYQIVFAEGCDTLMIGPALLDNVNKQGQNIDIVTTTTMSDASTSPLNNFISRLIQRDSHGRHRPLTIRTMLSDLDPIAMYGVHGVNDNPRVHPYSIAENFCATCSSNADCGGAGNNCVKVVEGVGRRCTAACTSDDACPDGFSCKAPPEESQILEKICVPDDQLCELAE